MMKGKVILVGAGPEAGMITIDGIRALKSADAILYDDLIDKDLLFEAPSGCEIIPVGKRHGIEHKSQEEIESLLIEKASEGKTVIRLKGGDGFVFGRGGEEMLALAKAGIGCSIIPGVTSAVAVPERFGIPVTHRGAAESFTVITGHGSAGRAIDFGPLAKLKGTLIFMMGIHMLGQISDELIKNGKDPETPACVLSRGYMPGEKRIDGCLADIAELAKDAETPGIIVIGNTAAMDLTLGNAPGGELTGVRVLAAGSESFNSKLDKKLSALGADVARCDLLKIESVPEAFPEDISGYNWAVFTSAAGVRGFFEGLTWRGEDIRSLGPLKFACVGEGTAEVLKRYGIHADLIPEKASGLCLGKALSGAAGENERLLLMQGTNASMALPEELDSAGLRYDICNIYETRACALDISFSIHDPFDLIVFSSAAAVRAFFASSISAAGGKDAAAGACTPNNNMPAAVCMGKAAAEELEAYCEKAGLSTDILIPDAMSVAGVCETIIKKVNARIPLSFGTE